MDAKSVEVALNALQDSYTKILLVNLTTREFTAIRVPQEEEEAVTTFKTIDDYAQWYVDTYKVHSEDVNKFISFFNTAKSKDSVSYRRILVRSTMLRHLSLHFYMSVLPTNRYTEDNKEVLLYVKDIDTLYVHEEKEVERRAKRYDGMTGLLNKEAFDQDVHSLSGNVGVAFIDINGLKYANDTFGHVKGDELIMKSVALLKERFPAYNVYRTGGDEFIVVANNVKLRVFLHTVISFHKSLWGTELPPIMSVGYSCDPADDFKEILEDAETQMYEDKKMFYEKYPEYNVRLNRSSS